MVAYRIDYQPVVVKQDIPALPKATREQIRRAIEQRLMVDPIAFGKPLRFGLYGQRRLRVGDYRVVYTVDTARHIVTIHAIGHRKAVYD